MATFGNTTSGANQSARIAADTKVANQFFAPEDGAVTDVTFEIQNDGAAIQAVRAGIYTSTAGTIGSFLASSGSAAIAAGAPRTWVTLSLTPSILVTAGQAVYPTIHFGPTGGNVSYWRSAEGGGSNTRYIANDSWTDGLSAPWGVTTLQDQTDLAIYCTYTPSASLPSPGSVRRFGGRELMRIYTGVG